MKKWILLALAAVPTVAHAAPAKPAPPPLSAVRTWSCNGVTGPFTMRFSNVQTAGWGAWGSVSYSPANPFDYIEGSDGYDYRKADRTFNIGANGETGEEGIVFYIQGRTIIAQVGTGANSVQCRPAAK